MRRPVAFLFLLAPALWGQAADQSELIRALLARVDALEKRVAELEGAPPSQRAAAPPPSTPAATQAPAEAVPPQPAPPAPFPPVVPLADQLAAENRGLYPSLKIAGFADFNFQATDRPGTRSGFNEGQFVLHFSSALSSRVTYFGELSLTARPDAGLGHPSAPGFNPEVERSIIRFDQSDYLKVSFGRYHTPVNYWNNMFHHGAWLQTTISRPEMALLSANLIPIHFIGALAEGSVPAGGLNLNYNFGFGNGRGHVISRGGDHGDDNNNRAWLVNAFVKPDSLYGLQVGGSVYRDKIQQPGLPAFREWISAAHFAWTRETPEILAEFANFSRAPVAGGAAHSSQALYVQTAYRRGLLKPYYRFDYIRIPADDPVMAGARGVKASTIGLRYDISSFTALKWEYRRTSRVGLPPANGAFVQTAFTF